MPLHCYVEKTSILQRQMLDVSLVVTLYMMMMTRRIVMRREDAFATIIMYETRGVENALKSLNVQVRLAINIQLRN